MLASYLLWPALVAFFARAQTITTTDPISGQTVTEVVSTDPQGALTTLTMYAASRFRYFALTECICRSTLTTQATTQTTQIPTTTTTTTTPPNNPQGPVGQPAATTAMPGAPTPFTFTTIINGQTVISTAIFTPTNPATTPVVPTMSGTIWDLSSYLQKYGPTTPVGAAKSTSGMGHFIYLSIQIALICALEHLLVF
ncbi:hypothetical protein AX15_001454 [Amanita polypyramis BW_CC]|nr:hypothetical protein AX15_001454 [Amanita polypyramis BW_CC]